MSNPQQLVPKLWNYCNILRDDGFFQGLTRTFTLGLQVGLLRLVFAGLLLIALTGCSMTVRQRMAVQQFATATTDFASVTRGEFIESRKDVMDMNRMRVLLGATNVEALEDPFTLETTQARLRALDALNRYGELLLVLLTTSSSAELQTSADDFVSSLNGVQGVGFNAEQGEMLGKAITLGGGLLVEHKRAKAMKRVVELAHPHLTNVISLVERDFDPNDDWWSAGYRRARLDLENAIRKVPSAATNDLASARIVRAARLATKENKLRFELVSENILGSVKRLRQAEEQLLAAMTSNEITINDIKEYRAKVKEMKTQFELLRSKANSKHP